MIEERVGPIIERGDILFNNLRNIQRRRNLRNPNSGHASPENLLDFERDMIMGAQSGYSLNMIKKIKQVKFIDLRVPESSDTGDEPVCSIC